MLITMIYIYQGAFFTQRDRLTFGLSIKDDEEGDKDEEADNCSSATGMI